MTSNNLSAFMQTLQKLAGEGGGGTFFVVTEDNQQVRMGIVRGQVTCVSLRRFRGMEAVQEMARSGVRSFMYTPGEAPPPQPNTPTVAEIIAILRAPSGAAARPAAGATPAAAPSAAKPAANFPKLILTVLEEELFDYVGPIASVIVDDHKGAVNLDRLLDALAANIDDPEEARRFREDAWKRAQYPTIRRGATAVKAAKATAPADPAMEARQLTITGTVQGVGFRASMAQAANVLSLSGWVRNRRDGSVEAVVSGEAEAVARIVAWARRGPPGARVDQVHVEHLEPQGIAGFSLQPTV